MAGLGKVTISESPCLGCLREGLPKAKCAGKCYRLIRWQDLDEWAAVPPVPIERVRISDIPQGESCMFRIVKKHVVWRGD